mgnify:CR=1 FL=1
MLETYYKDGSALFSVTIAKEKRITAVDAIRQIIGDDNAMTGSAVSTAVATASTVSEISTIAAIAVAFVLLVLLLTTTSFAEPFLVMAGLGVAVIINAGSNLMFGEISFVTNAAGSILQLAVSLDYSVFLLHRFAECRQTTTDPKDAMVEALTMSTTSILSSGLTTVIGFLALCLMQFRIGPDLGLALAKGVALSLITVFTFMPALILKTYKIIDKTEHRSFMPSFQGFGRFVSRVMLLMVLVFAILIVPCYLASNANSFYYGASHIFGSATQMELSQALRDILQVRSILSYVDTVGAAIPEQYLDSGTLSKLNSDSYTRMVLTMDAAYEGDAAFSLVEAVRDAAERCYPGTWYLAGEGVSAYDLMDTVTADMDKVDEPISAIGDLDDGAWELHDGTEELYDATKTLNGKVGDLHSGVGDLTAGAGDLYTGLTGIAAQNQQLTSGAYTAYEGLCTATAAALNSQLEANGMDAVALTPSTYSAVLMSLLEKLDADVVYQETYDTALEQVTLQVNERADELYRDYVDSQANSVYLAYVTAQADVYLQTAEGQALVAQAADNMTEEQKAQILNASVATVSAAAAGAGSLKLNMDTLYSSTGKLKLSVGELRDAVGELYDGTGEFTNGTSEFVDQTSDMDPQISDEIDSMTNSFSGGDGDTISFVSEKNTHVNAVQFVIKTAAIEKAEVPLDDAGESAPLTFWQKLLRLVGLYA